MREAKCRGWGATGSAETMRQAVVRPTSLQSGHTPRLAFTHASISKTLPGALSTEAEHAGVQVGAFGQPFPLFSGITGGGGVHAGSTRLVVAWLIADPRRRQIEAPICI
jgi:hypothetical protein